MVLFYADSSVLVKRHVVETGSAWVTRHFAAAQRHEILSSRLSTVEVISALNRRLREGTMTTGDYQMLRDDFLSLCRHTYRIVPITSTLLNRTRALLELHPLRSYDALHLASALVVHDHLIGVGQPALTFLAADTRLLNAATAEGLTVINPNNEP